MESIMTMDPIEALNAAVAKVVYFPFDMYNAIVQQMQHYPHHQHQHQHHHNHHQYQQYQRLLNTVSSFSAEPKAKKRRVQSKPKTARKSVRVRVRVKQQQPNQQQPTTHLGHDGHAQISFRPQSEFIAEQSGVHQAASRLPCPSTSVTELPKQQPQQQSRKRNHNGFLASKCAGPSATQIEVVDVVSEDEEEVQEEEEGKTTAADLLPEILTMVFEYLDVPSKGRVAQVCKMWRDNVYRKSVWRGTVAKIRLQSPRQKSYKDHQRSYEDHMALRSSFERKGIHDVQVLGLGRSVVLVDSVVNIKNLNSLNFSGCFNLTNSHLERMLSRRQPILSLQYLNLSLCKNISDVSLQYVARMCKNLEALDLSGCNQITDMGLCHISGGLEKLKRLNLRSCRQITDNGIGYLSGSERSHTIRGVNYNTAGVKLLEELCLQDCQKLSDVSLNVLSEHLKLRKINLSFCVSITDSGLKSLARVSSLRVLNFRSCDNVSDIGIGFLAEAGSQLTSLDVSFCTNVTNASTRHIAAGLTSLQHLFMSNCSICDDGLMMIAKKLKNLKVLNIGQCSGVTDKSLITVIEEMQDLTKVDLYGCPKVSREVVEKIRKMPKMEAVNQLLYQG